MFKTLALIVIFVIGSLAVTDSTITRDSTWKDAQGCYYTITSTYNDSTWVKSDSVIVRCPNGIRAVYLDLFKY